MHALDVLTLSASVYALAALAAPVLVPAPAPSFPNGTSPGYGTVTTSPVAPPASSAPQSTKPAHHPLGLQARRRRLLLLPRPSRRQRQHHHHHHAKSRHHLQRQSRLLDRPLRTSTPSPRTSPVAAPGKRLGHRVAAAAPQPNPARDAARHLRGRAGPAAPAAPATKWRCSATCGTRGRGRGCRTSRWASGCRRGRAGCSSSSRSSTCSRAGAWTARRRRRSGG